MWFIDKLLLNRIKDLERTIESLTGQNQILSQELEKSQNKEEMLLQKIFNFAGLNSNGNGNHKQVSQDPVMIGGKKPPWNKVRESLETEAKRKYWETKEAEQKIKEMEAQVKLDVKE